MTRLPLVSALALLTLSSCRPTSMPKNASPAPARVEPTTETQALEPGFVPAAPRSRTRDASESNQDPHREHQH